jgi:hypothetical protein
MRTLLFILLFFTQIRNSDLNAKNILRFRPIINNSNLTPGQVFSLTGTDSTSVTELRFYISSVALYSKGHEVWLEKNSFHLVDITVPASLEIALSSEAGLAFDEIRFKVGIDSVTNVSGALSGDLDPTKGMYWTWQSGYINLKIEGVSSLSKGRNQQFQFHLGGYQPPFSSIRNIELKNITPGNIEIVFDAGLLLQSIDLQKTDHIMSPCKEAMAISDKLPSIFRIGQ